jgi:hypothetical protein
MTKFQSLLVSMLFILNNCSLKSSDSELDASRRRKLAKEGEQCANGVFGTPNIPCEKGLICFFPNGTTPSGPSGSSSAKTGICANMADEGETCANGVFGTPLIVCGKGLECVYKNDSTRPVGPDGSSSAATGICKHVASLGETCGNGVFGSPNISCAKGLVCEFPKAGTAPTGPAGSSSAVAGKCVKGSNKLPID